MQYGFYFNGDACTGCKACAMACKDKNDMAAGVKLRRVLDYATGSWDASKAVPVATGVGVFSVSLSCMHCATPACVEACPTGAMQKDSETGIVTSDHDACIACGSCREACPYDAPRVLSDRGYTGKCDLCGDLLAAGEKPACVAACNMRCLEVDDVEKLREKYGDLSVTAPLPGPEATGPSYFMNPSRLTATDATLTNSPEEVE